MPRSRAKQDDLSQGKQHLPRLLIAVGARSRRNPLDSGCDAQRFCHENVILSGSDWMKEDGHVAQNGDCIDGDSRGGDARA
jgi:hypothetical protein